MAVVVSRIPKSHRGPSDAARILGMALRAPDFFRFDANPLVVGEHALGRAGKRIDGPNIWQNGEFMQAMGPHRA